MDSAASLLTAARRQAGLSQRAAAAAAGVRQPMVSRIESGRVQPSLLTLARLVRACGFRLRVRLEPLADAHDLSLLEVTLALTPEARIDRLIALLQATRSLQAAVEAARPTRP